jgi:hypothetical protein
MFAVIASSATIVPVMIVLGLLLSGAVYFVYLLMCRRDVLEHEPGGADGFLPSSATSTQR